MFKKTMVALLLVFFTSVSFAENYFGLAYSRIDFDGDVTPSSLEAKIGVSKGNFGVEGRFAIPLFSDTIDDFGFDIDVESKYFGVALTAGQQVYGLIGFFDLEIELSSGGISESASEKDTVVGLGFKASEDGGFFGEYLIGRGDFEDITFLNLGYRKPF